ncbi:MAG: hypothetical protein HRT65_14215 [Flavobacteriaceae bacterium]|nr:hypothetical protein [Flavobacteriaceae bacterium]
MKIFEQKKFFTKREFKITESKLYFNISKFGDGNEIDIPFENIDGDKVSFKSTNGFALSVALLFYFVGITTYISSNLYGENEDPYLALFWLGLGTVMLVIYFVTKKDFWKIKLSNNSYVYVHKKIPSEEKTNEFLDELINTRNRYLRENYAIVDEHLNYENQLGNFRWLKSINAITKEEFDQKYEELKRTVKPEKRNVGFGK